MGFLDLTDTAPATPPAGTIRLFRRVIGGRQMPAFVGPAGQSTTLQANLSRNKISQYVAAGGGTVISNVAFPTATVLGTATTRSVTNTSFWTRLRKLGYVSAATAAAFAGFRFNNHQAFSLGTGTGLGGFHYVQRFGIGDAAVVAGARMFVGMSATNAAPTNVEPSTLLNLIGVGHGAADTNMMLYISGTAAQPAINLGASFPNTPNIPYELAIFSSTTEANKLYWEVTRLDTGVTAQGDVTVTAATGPISSVLLSAGYSWRCNNATLLAVALDHASIYIETDD